MTRVSLKDFVAGVLSSEEPVPEVAGPPDEPWDGSTELDVRDGAGLLLAPLRDALGEVGPLDVLFALRALADLGALPALTPPRRDASVTSAWWLARMLEAAGWTVSASEDQTRVGAVSRDGSREVRVGFDPAGRRAVSVVIGGEVRDLAMDGPVSEPHVIQRAWIAATHEPAVDVEPDAVEEPTVEEPPPPAPADEPAVIDDHEAVDETPPPEPEPEPAAAPRDPNALPPELQTVADWAGGGETNAWTWPDGRALRFLRTPEGDWRTEVQVRRGDGAWHDPRVLLAALDGTAIAPDTPEHQGRCAYTLLTEWPADAPASVLARVPWLASRGAVATVDLQTVVASLSDGSWTPTPDSRLHVPLDRTWNATTELLSDTTGDPLRLPREAGRWVPVAGPALAQLVPSLQAALREPTPVDVMFGLLALATLGHLPNLSAPRVGPDPAAPWWLARLLQDQGWHVSETSGASRLLARSSDARLSLRVDERAPGQRNVVVRSPFLGGGFMDAPAAATRAGIIHRGTLHDAEVAQCGWFAVNHVP